MSQTHGCDRPFINQLYYKTVTLVHFLIKLTQFHLISSAAGHLDAPTSYALLAFLNCVRRKLSRHVIFSMCFPCSSLLRFILFSFLDGGLFHAYLKTRCFLQEWLKLRGCFVINAVLNFVLDALTLFLACLSKMSGHRPPEDAYINGISSLLIASSFDSIGGGFRLFRARYQ